MFFLIFEKIVEVGGDIHLADYYGRTPLHVAAASDHHDMVAFLIANGANVNAVTVHDAKHLATMDAKVELFSQQGNNPYHCFSYQIKIKRHYISQQRLTQRNRALFYYQMVQTLKLVTIEIELHSLSQLN